MGCHEGIQIPSARTEASSQMLGKPSVEIHILLTCAQLQMFQLEKTLGIILVNFHITDSETEPVRGLNQCSQMLAHGQYWEAICPGERVTNMNFLFPSHQQEFD